MELYKTDWLASEPIFYNEKTSKVSKNINEVIDFRNLEFDPEGFNNYLRFGYSVFEQTPVKNVKFMRYSSELTVNDDGKIDIKYLKDPAESWEGRTSHEDTVLELIETSIQRWEEQFQNEIVIPTSGGYDSRLLNLMVKNKTRIRSFTYGISDFQEQSYEVIYAKKLSEALNTKWQQIELGEFHKYLSEWVDIYGVSTHAHGMYHMEFYNKIKMLTGNNKNLLSGIIGDAWAGNVDLPVISYENITALGYCHGLYANELYSKLKSNNYLAENFLNMNKNKLNSPFWKIIFSMRTKIILLSYLTRIPNLLGFNVYAPFLDINIALNMLTLPENRRCKRAWQQDYFKSYGVDFERMNLKVSHKNSLDYQAIKKINLTPLNENLLKEVVYSNYVGWINKKLQSATSDSIHKLISIPKIGYILRRLGLKDELLVAYNAYLVLYPIQCLLEERNRA